MQLASLLSAPKEPTKQAHFNRQQNNSWSTASLSSSEVENAAAFPLSSRHSSDTGSPISGVSDGRFRFQCSKFAMDKAAQGGHVEMLKLLHEKVDKKSVPDVKYGYS